MTTDTSLIRTAGSSFVGPDGKPLLLRGVCLGGWLNMENFITGYAANETLMRREVRQVLGDDRAERFFERLLTRFFAEKDATFLGEAGFNLVRIAVGYKHLEDDARPFEIKPDGFRHLDRAVESLASHGVYSIIDLHALPGSQNHHWHSDNPTHVPGFWEHRHFQDRVVHLWEAIADHYRGNGWVAGYNLLNEPADESGTVVGPFYRRLVTAIRDVDPDHVVFLDGNTYATEFGFFEEPLENAVYTLHDYVPAGLGRSPYYSREEAEQKFLQRSEYARSTDTRSWGASLDRSTPGTRLRTSGSAACWPTSSTSIADNRRAGRCGCTRTSAGKAWSRCDRTPRTGAGLTTTWLRRTDSPPTSGAPTASASPR